MKTLIFLILLMSSYANAQIIDGDYVCYSDRVGYEVRFKIIGEVFSIYNKNEFPDLSLFLKYPDIHERFRTMGWRPNLALENGKEGIAKYRVRRVLNADGYKRAFIEYKNTEGERGLLNIELSDQRDGSVEIRFEIEHSTEYPDSVVVDRNVEQGICVRDDSY